MFQALEREERKCPHSARKTSPPRAPRSAILRLGGTYVSTGLFRLSSRNRGRAALKLQRACYRSDRVSILYLRRIGTFDPGHPKSKSSNLRSRERSQAIRVAAAVKLAYQSQQLIYCKSALHIIKEFYNPMRWKMFLRTELFSHTAILMRDRRQLPSAEV